jgi:hypothetical protein
MEFDLGALMVKTSSTTTSNEVRMILNSSWMCRCLAFNGADVAREMGAESRL